MFYSISNLVFYGFFQAVFRELRGPSWQYLANWASNSMWPLEDVVMLGPVVLGIILGFLSNAQMLPGP